MSRFSKAAQEKRLNRAARECRKFAGLYTTASLATRDRATAGHLAAVAEANASDAIALKAASLALYHRNYIGHGY